MLTFDGRTWSRLASPGPSTGQNQLTGVSCPRAGSCVAVGSTAASRGPSRGPVVTLSNGRARVVAGASGPAGEAVLLWAVSCPEVGWCTAVGATRSGNAPFLTLAMSLVGGRWQTAHLPPSGAPNAYFNAVSCVAQGDSMAVGGAESSAAVPRPLAELRSADGRWHMTGAVGPEGGVLRGDLMGVACGGGRCVAVGSAATRRGPNILAAPLVETFDGATWWLSPAQGPSEG